MKTMTEEQCRAFVISGFIPTSNQDIADIQDCFNHQSVDFQLGLLIDEDTSENAERLMRACLHCADEVDSLVAQANDIRTALYMRKQYTDHIARLEQKIKDLQEEIQNSESLNARYGKYMS